MYVLCLMGWVALDAVIVTNHFFFVSGVEYHILLSYVFDGIV
jgi:hypothetical protein